MDSFSPAAGAETTSGQSDAQQSTESNVEQVAFRITYGKKTADLKRPADSTVAELKAEVEKLFGVPPELQKLMLKGMIKTDDTLQRVGIKNGSKMLLIGSSREEQQAAAQAPPAAAAAAAWDATPEVEVPLSKQTQHAKVLAKGPPDDAVPGIKGRQVPLPEAQQAIPGLLNGQGNKVRLTFKPELEQVWIGSATHTQKIAYNMVHRIDSYAIEGQEEYSMLSVQLDKAGSSKYWLYFVPSQHVAGIKMRILGIRALI